MNQLEIVLASDYEEFYYEGTDEPVPEGEPVGVDWRHNNIVDFYLLDNIYHEFKYEEEDLP
tara:strand:+ start:808 stop:990 length:183 start_codon:yes stop_codon:yes gene_type:complete